MVVKELIDSERSMFLFDLHQLTPVVMETGWLCEFVVDVAVVVMDISLIWSLEVAEVRVP